MPAPVKKLTPVDDRKANGLGCNEMKPPASGARGRICPEVSLNLQVICQNADTISLLFFRFVHQNERVTHFIHEFVIDHRSYTHNLSSCVIKA